MYESAGPSEPDPAERPATVLLQRLVATPPAPAVMIELGRLDAALLDPHEQALRIQVWNRQVSWVQAQELTAIADLAGPEPPADDRDDDFAACEVAAALRLSPLTGHTRVALARSLTAALAPTMAALAAGTLTFPHVLTVEHELAGKDPELVAAVQAQVLEGAATSTRSELGTRLRTAVATTDPVALEEAHAEAAQQRSVRLYPEPDGMASLHATLVASDAQLVYDTLTRTAMAAARAERAAARRQGLEPDAPGLAARRADALVALVRGGGARAAAASAGGDAQDAGNGHRSARRRIGVIVGLASLLGTSDAPGELAGYGALPARVCRLLAKDADWQLLVADAQSGRLVGMSRGAYRPPKELIDFIGLRDPTCVFPGCAMPAWRCDNDHRLAYDAGGATCADNLHPLCRYHHRAKTHGGWTVATDPDSGATIWTSPAGMRYVVPPARYPPE